MGTLAELSGKSDAAKALANDINALMKKDAGSVTAKMKGGGTITISKDGNKVTIRTENTPLPATKVKVSMTGVVSETKSGEIKISNLQVSGVVKVGISESPLNFSSAPSYAKIFTDSKALNHLFMYRDAPAVVRGA